MITRLVLLITVFHGILGLHNLVSVTTLTKLHFGTSLEDAIILMVPVWIR